MKTILTIGTSITFGQGGGGTTWPGVMQSRLDAEYPGQYTVINAGVAGQDTTSRLSALPALLAAHSPDFVIMENGWNDTYNGIPIPTQRSNITSMIALCIAAGSMPIMTTITPLTEGYGLYGTASYPDGYGTPGYSRDDTRRWVYDHKAWELSTAAAAIPAIMTIDFYSAVADLTVTPPPGMAHWGNPSYYSDGIHPNATGYSALGSVIDTAIFQDVVSTDIFDTIPYLYTGSGMMVGGYSDISSQVISSFGSTVMKIYHNGSWLDVYPELYGEYEDNAAALAGGLIPGMMYNTTTGAVMIVREP